MNKPNVSFFHVKLLVRVEKKNKKPSIKCTPVKEAFILRKMVASDSAPDILLLESH